MAFPGLLSAEERDRSERYRLAGHRRRYAQSHALLRLLLGRYLYTPAADIRFRLGPYGKPRIETSENIHDLRFNTSTSDGHWLCAVTRGSEVGVDIERVQDIPEMDQMIPYCFRPRSRHKFHGCTRVRGSVDFSLAGHKKKRS